MLELRAGDDIVAVDGADVAHHYLESVQSVISQAVSVGQLELRIRRVVKRSQSSTVLGYSASIGLQFPCPSSLLIRGRVRAEPQPLMYARRTISIRQVSLPVHFTVFFANYYLIMT